MPTRDIDYPDESEVDGRKNNIINNNGENNNNNADEWTLGKILDRGIDPNAQSLEDKGQRRTLLCLAIQEAVQTKEFSRVELLLGRKADVNLSSETGDFPLMLAVNAEHLNCARTLLRGKADPNKQDPKGVAALHTAV